MAKSSLLTDPRHVRLDCKTLINAVKKRWPIDDKDEIVKRLRAIVNKESVVIHYPDGGEGVSEATADRNATAAAKVLLALEAQNQADEHHEEGSKMNHVHTIEQRNDRISTVATELGIDPSLIALPEGTAVIDVAAVASVHSKQPNASADQADE